MPTANATLDQLTNALVRTFHGANVRPSGDRGLFTETDGVNPSVSWRLEIKPATQGWNWYLIKITIVDGHFNEERQQDGGFNTMDGAQGMFRMWAEHLECLAAERELCGDKPELSRI